MNGRLEAIVSASASPNARDLVHLYSDVELALLDHGNQDDEYSKSLTELKGRLGLDQYPQDKKETLMSGLRALIRLVICVGCFVALMPLLTVIAPISVFNILLRRCGVSNRHLPLDAIQKGVLQWVAMSLGAKVTVEGADEMMRQLKGSAAVFMFSHSSNLDPPVVAAVCPVSIKFVGKKILFMIPWIGQLFRLYGNIPIDRNDLRSAIESLDEAVGRAKSDQRSIGIAPEGTRSRNGQLQNFKKGGFHLAAKAGLPIVPVIVQDAYSLMPSGQMLPRPGHVSVRFLAPLHFQSDQGRPNIDLMIATVRKAMLQSLKIPPHPRAHQHQFTLLYTIIMPAMAASIAAIAWFIVGAYY